MIQYIWEVKIMNTPFLKRKCSHCSSDRFYCSEKFRMNAQKKNIDIWLIYNCLKCGSSYNMTIFSRIKPENIDKNLFNKFSENCTKTAWDYAFSRETARKNNVELDFESVRYELEYEKISAEDILNGDHDIITFEIKYPFDFNLKFSSVIKKCLQLSTNKLNQLIKEEAIHIPQGPLQKKHKIKNKDIVQINRVRLKSMYNS